MSVNRPPGQPRHVYTFTSDTSIFASPNLDDFKERILHIFSNPCASGWFYIHDWDTRNNHGEFHVCKKLSDSPNGRIVETNEDLEACFALLEAEMKKAPHMTLRSHVK